MTCLKITMFCVKGCSGCVLVGPTHLPPIDTDSVTGISLNLPKLDSDISTNKHNYLHIRIPQPMPLAWNGHLARLSMSNTNWHTTDLMGGPPQNRPARRHTPVGSEPTALNHASAINYEQPHKITPTDTPCSAPINIRPHYPPYGTQVGIGGDYSRFAREL